MKKVGYLAVQTHNYGSLLQTYALQKVLDNLGYDNEIIYFKKTNYIKQALRLFNIPLLKQTIAKVKKKIVIKTMHKELAKVFDDRGRAFNAFIQKYLRFSPVYVGRKELVANTKNYDCFVLGSDQVWNPMNYGSDFFSMTFIPDEKNKVVYAPSFGVTKIPHYQKKGTISFLNHVTYLSVREVSGQKLIKELIGKEAKVVVDPTMLLERKYWDDIKGLPIVKEPYIMCYFLGADPNHREFSKQLQNLTGYKIVSLPHMDEIVDSDFGFGDIDLSSVGPEQFINLISNAAYVCTDSFHGTVFSILYHKHFFTFDRYNSTSRDSTNSRLNSILEICGLESQKRDSSIPVTLEMLEKIDFTETEKRIDDLRQESIQYLVNSLSEFSEVR